MVLMLPETETNFSYYFLTHLNLDQHCAAALPAEHALILAGEGSGNTWVLTTRIA